MKQHGKPNPSPSSLSRSSSLVLGAATLLASGVFLQGLGFLTLIVTARLLKPEDFGIIAYFMIATGLLEMMQRQIAMVLIRLDDVTNDHLYTVFTIQVCFGLIMAGLFWIADPFIVAVFGIPELAGILPAISALSILIALRSPRFLLYERGLRFSLAAVEEVLSRFAYSVAAITLAWLWRDFWAIIFAVSIGLLARSIFTFAAAPMLPKPSLSRWRESLSFSSWSMGAQLSQFFANNMPLLIIGSAMGLADAGIYRIGNRIASVVTTQFFAPLQRVIYPGLADVSRSSGRGKDAFIRINMLLLAIVLPVSVGTALVATDVIWFGLGYKWIAAAQVIWVMAPLRAMETLQANVRAASYIAGSTKSLFFRNTLLLILVYIYMRIGTQFDFHGALFAAGFSSFTALLITLVLAKRYGNGGFFEPLTVAWRSFLSCLVMMVVVIGVDTALRSGVHVPRILVIVLVKVSVGVVVYTTTHIALWALAGRPEGFETLVFSLLSRLRNRLKRSRA